MIAVALDSLSGPLRKRGKETLRAELFAQTIGAAGFVIVPQWQPINTAPKDGADILLFCRKDYRDRPNGELMVWCEVGHWGEAHSDEETWTEDRDQSPLPATHWMPLPSPPQDPKP